MVLLTVVLGGVESTMLLLTEPELFEFLRGEFCCPALIELEGPGELGGTADAGDEGT